MIAINMIEIVAGAALVVVLLRDLVFRIFFIHPRTNASGRYAAFIEEHHIYRWLAPVVAGQRGRFDVFFVGNSHVMDGVDPAIITQQTGYKAYNLGFYSLPSLNALQLLFKYRNFPRLVCIDFSTRYSLYRYLPHIEACVDQALRMNRWMQLRFWVRDHCQWLLPSLFVPHPYHQFIRRGFSKLRTFIESRQMVPSRYSPYRLLVSYEWELDKTTNHRIARNVRRPSRWQLAFDSRTLEEMIRETAESCTIGSDAYKTAMQETRQALLRLQKEGVRIVLMRMPLHPRMIEHENTHFDQYFQDLRNLARELDLEYLDLTEPAHAEQIGPLTFYSDGLHLLHPSDQSLSRYLAGVVCKQLTSNPMVRNI